MVQRNTTHPSVKKLFEGRKVVVASMHGKHYVMKPLIKQFLGIDVVIVPEIDTDQFGTFSGEIERPFDPVTTLRRKIRKGLEASGESLGIGNEGSFGPHPHIPFLQANEEIVMLIDLENDIEVVERVVSTETNHAQQQISCMKDMLDFTQRAKFPSHGIILKQMKDGKVLKMRKGILMWELLHALMLQYKSTDTILVAETDMRGYMNPTRMKVIERATELLLKKVTSLCPVCQFPGFGPVNTIKGIPCRNCAEPTRLPIGKVYECGNCGFKDERYYTQLIEADPENCDRCNP